MIAVTMLCGGHGLWYFDPFPSSLFPPLYFHLTCHLCFTSKDKILAHLLTVKKRNFLNDNSQWLINQCILIENLGRTRTTANREKIGKISCVKSVRIQSYSDPYFPAFGLNTERYFLSLRIQSECGKIRTRIAPNTDNFHAVDATLI